MRTLAHDMRGMPLWLLREYLLELGGTAVDEHQVRAPGWSARLEPMEPFRLGSLEVGQVRVTVEIEDHLADDFVRRFGLKTLRAGG